MSARVMPLCTADSCPIAVEVFEGSTGDPKTVAAQVDKIRNRFGLQRIVLVGDRGMLTGARIREDLQGIDGLRWITTLRAPTIRKLIKAGALVDLVGRVPGAPPERPTAHAHLGRQGGRHGWRSLDTRCSPAVDRDPRRSALFFSSSINTEIGLSSYQREPAQMRSLSGLVIQDSEIMSGTPVFAGTRVPVQSLWDHLDAGDSLDKFLDSFPSVSRRQAKEVLELAGELLVDRAHSPR